MRASLRRLAAASPPTPPRSFVPPFPPSPPHNYGLLEAHVAGSAGASLGSPGLAEVDSLRAETLLRAKMHLGHHKRSLSRMASGSVHGFRHNIAVYDINKTWRSLRTLFHGFAEMAEARSSFFLLAPNPYLPIEGLVEKMRAEYPFKYNKFSSLYMLGYSDKRWIDGLLSNWKMTYAFAEKMRRAAGDSRGVRFKRYVRYLRGVEGLDAFNSVVPDFILVLAGDKGAFHEARNLDIPLFGLSDTNANPSAYLYPVLANDDSVESVALLLDVLKRGVEEGRKREHEAFAIMLLRKIKARLDPAYADVNKDAAEAAEADARREGWEAEEPGPSDAALAAAVAAAKTRQPWPLPRV